MISFGVSVVIFIVGLVGLAIALYAAFFAAVAVAAVFSVVFDKLLNWIFDTPSAMRRSFASASSEIRSRWAAVASAHAAQHGLLGAVSALAGTLLMALVLCAMIAGVSLVAFVVIASFVSG